MWLNSNQIFLRGFSCPFEITSSIAAPLYRMKRPTGLIKPRGCILSARSAAFWTAFACLSADKNGTPTKIAIPNVSLDDPSIADNFAVRRRAHADAANSLGSRVSIVGGGRQVKAHPTRSNPLDLVCSCLADYLGPAEGVFNPLARLADTLRSRSIPPAKYGPLA
jgi:hypothetical protein